MKQKLSDKIKDIMMSNISPIVKCNGAHEFGTTYKINGFENAAKQIVEALKENKTIGREHE